MVLQQPVRVLVPQGQVEEGRTKEVYQKQVLQVQAVECQAQEEEPSPRVLEVVEGCPLNRLQKMEVGAGLDYSLLHQRQVVPEVYQKQVPVFPRSGVGFHRAKMYPHQEMVVGLVNPEQAVVLSRLVEEQARMNHHLQMKEEGEDLPGLFGMCFPLAREEEGERTMEGEARKIRLQSHLHQLNPQ